MKLVFLDNSSLIHALTTSHSWHYRAELNNLSYIKIYFIYPIAILFMRTMKENLLKLVLAKINTIKYDKSKSSKRLKSYKKQRIWFTHKLFALISCESKASTVDFEFRENRTLWEDGWINKIIKNWTQPNN